MTGRKVRSETLSLEQVRVWLGGVREDMRHVFGASWAIVREEAQRAVGKLDTEC